MAGRGFDLNCGGMAVVAGIELCLEEQVSVEFTPPRAEQPLRIRASVRNRNDYTYGVAFIREDVANYSNVQRLEAILKSLD